MEALKGVADSLAEFTKNLLEEMQQKNEWQRTGNIYSGRNSPLAQLLAMGKEASA